jgi:NAD(P)-dependent dehydrogenase (short-subunit alcohol dehydrogenase family)
VALVTGAANGIGRSIFTSLLDAGYAVTAIDLNADALQRGLDERARSSALTVSGDAADVAVLRRAVSETLERFGRLDAAVFNAGIAGASAPLKSYPIDVFDEVMRVNVHGPWHGIQAVVPAMKAAAPARSSSFLRSTESAGLAHLRRMLPASKP